MNSIQCDFCKKQNLFNDNKISKSGKAELIRCEYCHRSITVKFKKEIYYKVIDKIDNI